MTRKQFFNPYDVNIKEQYYTICHNIESNLSNEFSIIMITSLTQTKKIPLVTAYLALAFSDQRKRVLVVDTNLRQPSLHHVFNIDNSFGLTTLLLNRNYQKEDKTVKVSEFLYCLPTGEVLYEPSALLTLEAYAPLLEEWKKHFDVILFHTSDCLNTPDAQIIAKSCTATVLVIQEGLDKFEKIINVKKQFERNKHEITGTVILS